MKRHNTAKLTHPSEHVAVAKDMSISAKPKILIVEDEALIAREIGNILTGLGYEVAGTAASGEEAIRLAAVLRPDLVLMDIVLSGNIDGVKSAEQIISVFDIPVVYLTAYADENTLYRAKITEPFGYILKPFKERELHTNIKIALYKHRTEKRLRESEQKARNEQAKAENIMENLGDPFSIQDASYRIIYMNKINRGMFGKRLGEYCYAVYEGRNDICPECPLKLTFADGGIHTQERKNPTRTLYVEITTSPLRDSDGKIIAGLEIARNITARKQAEHMLRESEERYRNLFENANDMIQSVGPDGKFIFANSAWFRTLGYTAGDLEKITMFDIIHQSCRDHCMETFGKVMAGEAADNIEATFVAKDGRLVEVEGNVNVRFADGKVIATQGIFRDVTERKKAEEEKRLLEQQLRHAQKIEAIGTLTAGISHEFNNILAAIIGYGEFLQDEVGPDNPLRAYVDMIHSSSLRAADLTRGLLAYSRKQIIKPHAVSLNEIVMETGKLLSRLIPDNMELTAICPDDDIIVVADSGQIEQVLINLTTNARDAMPLGGKITIETGLAEKQDHQAPSDKNGPYAFISVSDVGAGMDSATRERIFEPFFTTKEPGKGTGLGLSVVYGIVKQHNGFVNVISELSKGTTFKVYLPLAAAPDVKPE